MLLKQVKNNHYNIDVGIKNEFKCIKFISSMFFVRNIPIKQGYYNRHNNADNKSIDMF